MVIGDHLSDEQKEAYILANLIPGAVIYRFCQFTKPPKLKYLLVVQVRSDTALLVINSEINSFIANRQHLMDCQVLIDQASHSFLDHDSHIDCSHAEYEETTELVRELKTNMIGLKGRITPELKQQVINAIRQSFTISQAEIDQLVASLSI